MGVMFDMTLVLMCTWLFTVVLAFFHAIVSLKYNLYIYQLHVLLLNFDSLSPLLVIIF